MLSSNSFVICISSPGFTWSLYSINFSSGSSGIFKPCSGLTTGVLDMVDAGIEGSLLSKSVVLASWFNLTPKPESIRRFNVLSSSGDSGINVPTTTYSTSGDLCTICSALSLFCNSAKLPHPKYTK